MKKRIWSFILSVATIISIFPCSVHAEENASKAKRTILLYICGSNLETDYGFASFNIKQVLASRFSNDDDVRFIILTGGSYDWHMDSRNLFDPENPDADDLEISSEYNQIWEAKGTDSPENSSQMILLD